MLKISRLKTFFYNSVFQKINASLLYHIRYVSICRIVKHIPFPFEIRYIEITTWNFILLSKFVTIRIFSSVIYLFVNTYLIVIFFLLFTIILLIHVYSIIYGILLIIVWEIIYFFLFVYLINTVIIINSYYEFLWK